MTTEKGRGLICVCGGGKEAAIEVERCLDISPGTTEDISCDNRRDFFPGLSEFSLEYRWYELVTGTDNFDMSRVIGTGQSGTVYRGHVEDHDYVAIKVLGQGDRCQDKNASKALQDEVRLLSRCQHVNIVRLLGFCSSARGNQPALVYELLEGGSLLSRLESSASFPWEQRLAAGVEASRGFAHLHRHQPEVFHCNIKSASILFTANGVAKIAGFRSVRSAQQRDERSCVGGNGMLPGYAAPELAEADCVTEATEVYAMGIVLLELLTAEPAAMAISTGSGSLLLRDRLQPRGGSVVSDLLDDRAEWPTGVAAGVANLAMRSISSQAHTRPCFLELATMLQCLSVSAATPSPTSPLLAQEDARASPGHAAVSTPAPPSAQDASIEEPAAKQCVSNGPSSPMEEGSFRTPARRAASAQELIPSPATPPPVPQDIPRIATKPPTRSEDAPAKAKSAMELGTTPPEPESSRSDAKEEASISSARGRGGELESGAPLDAAAWSEGDEASVATQRWARVKGLLPGEAWTKLQAFQQIGQHFRRRSKGRAARAEGSPASSPRGSPPHSDGEAEPAEADGSSKGGIGISSDADWGSSPTPNMDAIGRLYHISEFIA